MRKHIKIFFLATSIIWFLLQAYLFSYQLKSILALVSATQIKYPTSISFDDISFVFVSFIAVMLILSGVLNKKFKYFKIAYSILAIIFLLRFAMQILISIKLISNTIMLAQADGAITTNFSQYAAFFGIALLYILASVALFIFALSKIFQSKKTSVFVMALLVISIVGYTVLTLVSIAQRKPFYLFSFVSTIIKNTLFLISIIGLNYIDNENKLQNSQNVNEINSVIETIN